MARWLVFAGAAALVGACSGSDDAVLGPVDAEVVDSGSGDVSVDDDAVNDDSGGSSDTPEGDTNADPDVPADTDANAGTDAVPDVRDETDGAVDGSGASDASGDASDGADGDAGLTEAVVVSFDFEAALPAFIDGGACALTPSQGYEPLGVEGNRFGPTFIRCQTGQVVAVTLTDLPAHTSVSVDFLFAAIDSLDGEGTFPAGDFFRVDVDGIPVFRESFANAIESQVQTYVPAVPEIVLARRVDLGFAVGGFYFDSAYDMSIEPRFDRIAHTDPTLTLTFQLEGEGVQSLDDESWAIDNLRVTTHAD